MPSGRIYISVLFLALGMWLSLSVPAQAAEPSPRPSPSAPVIHCSSQDTGCRGDIGRVLRRLAPHVRLHSGTSTGDTTPVLTLRTRTDSNGRWTLTVRHIKRPPLPQSPLLHPYLLTGSDELTIPLADVSVETAGRLVLGLAQYAEGRCDVALAHFQRVAIADNARVFAGLTGSAYASFHDAMCALMGRDYTKSAQTFGTLIDDTYQGHISRIVASNRAWALLQAGDSDDARDVLDTLVRRAPQAERPVAYTLRAELRALLSDYDGAISDVNRAIDLSPDNPALYTLRGQMRLYLYEWDNVLADYNAAIARDPTYAPAYFYRGVLYYSVLTDRIPRQTALLDFYRYLLLAPDGPQAAQAHDYVQTIRAELEALGH